MPAMDDNNTANAASPEAGGRKRNTPLLIASIALLVPYLYFFVVYLSFDSLMVIFYAILCMISALSVLLIINKRKTLKVVGGVLMGFMLFVAVMMYDAASWQGGLFVAGMYFGAALLLGMFRKSLPGRKQAGIN